MKLLRYLTIFMVMAVLAGCIGFNRVETSHTRTSSIGQELIDLQKAKDSGAITQQEYDGCKEKLLETFNKSDFVIKCEKSCNSEK